MSIGMFQKIQEAEVPQKAFNSTDLRTNSGEQKLRLENEKWFAVRTRNCTFEAMWASQRVSQVSHDFVLLYS